MITAETIANALGGHQAGGDWMARCPAHDDHNPSLSIRVGNDGRVLVHCHAGCEQELVINELRLLGLWEKGNPDHGRLIGFRSRQTPRHSTSKNLAERTELALRIWEATKPPEGTLVDTYLRSRGISVALPPTIGFHSGLKHPSGTLWPGLVALVTRGSDDLPLAVHRTFLSPEGTGKAPIEPQKMMLGPCRGGAVRLAAAEQVLMVGEGIETCLAAMQATGAPAWAALSTSGLRTLELPAEIREVIVLADGDEPGEAAALYAGRRWKREGRAVRIARPPCGMDFNDVLLDRLACEQGGAE
jgi:DNA primase